MRESRDPDPFAISQPATHATTLTQLGAIYEPILPDRRTQPCTGAFVNTVTDTHTHTHGSERNMSFSNAFTWALFALVNVNISTIFTPASVLPAWMCSATDPDASTIEMTWIFFFFPS